MRARISSCYDVIDVSWDAVGWDGNVTEKGVSLTILRLNIDGSDIIVHQLRDQI